MRFLRMGALTAATILGGAFVPAPGLASGGFEGTWQATDCATNGAAVDCSIGSTPFGDDPGDESTVTLVIGAGLTPRVSARDEASVRCDAPAAGERTWRAVGSGSYGYLSIEGRQDFHLFINVLWSGCGFPTQTGVPGDLVEVFHDPGSDTLWSDDDADGWGLIFHRVGGAVVPGPLFVGVWETTDCATDGTSVDCSADGTQLGDSPGDGSRLTLGIARGPEGELRVTARDSFSGDCYGSGSGRTSWRATATGERFDLWLFLDVERSGCAVWAEGEFATHPQLYHDPGSDTLWSDDDGDGWGLIFERVG